MSKSKIPDVKKPDQFLETLNRGFQWSISNSSLLLGILIVVLLIGGGAAAWSTIQQSKEADMQEKYYVLEKKILEKKRGFAEAEQKEKMKQSAAKAGQSAPKTDEPAGTLPTGDLAKDYGTLPEELNALIDAAPKSTAAEMAALNLAEIFARYQNPDEAMKVLNKVNTSNKSNDLIGALVVNMKANFMADKGDCGGAISLWENLAKESKAKFLHSEAKLRMGLCFETMNDLGKAEQMYSEVAAKDTKDATADSSAAKDAERYLRLLKMKKTSSGS